MKLGSTDINKLYLGSTEIKKAYLGSTLIYDKTGGAAFAPPDITNLKFWIDADDSNTITETSGAVSQWDDKSGNDYHVTQGTGSGQPETGTQTINSRNAVYFDTSLEYLSNASDLNIDGDFTANFLLSVSGDNNTLQYFLGTQGNTQGFYSGGTYNQSGISPGDTGVVGAGGALDISEDEGITNGTAFVATFIKDGTDLSLYINGTLLATKASAAFTGFSSILIGARNTGQSVLAFYGLIGEVTIYDRVLTASELNQLNGEYIADKWGITWTDIT